MKLTRDDLELMRRLAMLDVENAYRLPKLMDKLDEYRRGALPKNSMGDEAVSGTRGQPMPQRDRVDRNIDRAEDSIRHQIEQQWKRAQRLERALNFWLVPAPAEPERPACGNPLCENRLEDGRDTGECNRCRVWRTRHEGRPYPDGARLA